MDTELLHPMSTANLKQFAARVARASDDDVIAAWEAWKNQFSRNQRYVMQARIAKIARARKNDVPTPTRVEHVW